MVTAGVDRDYALLDYTAGLAQCRMKHSYPPYPPFNPEPAVVLPQRP